MTRFWNNFHQVRLLSKDWKAKVKRRAHQIRYLRLNYYHWVDTSACGLLVPKGIICTVVRAFVLTYFLLDIFFIQIYSS